MQTTNLRAFIAVAETGSFSRAAERLHLTQSAVSKRIAALEQEVGTRLFDRVGHQVVATEAGHVLLPRARRALGELEDGERALQNLRGRVAGRLPLGTSHHIGLHHLPILLRAYTQRYPHVELELSFLASEAACEAVHRGELELGVVTLPLVLPARLAAIPVWPDALVFVCGHGHALAQRACIAPGELAAHTAILPARGTTTREILENALAPHRVHVTTRMATNYLETIKMMASIDLGWSLLPRTLLDNSLHAFAVDGLRLERTLGIVHHLDRTLSNAAHRFVALMKAENPLRSGLK